MFDTLASKLNGGNLPSGQPNNQGNNNAFRAVTGNSSLSQENFTPDPNAQFSSNNHNHSRAGVHSTATSTTTGRAAVQPQPPPPLARRFKAFAKGFSGLGADVLSDLSRPFDHRQVVASSTTSKTTTTKASINTLPAHGSREHQAKHSAASFAASAGASNGNASTSVPVMTPPTAADTSFGGDDFFLDAEDLADLEHDLDLGQGSSKAKGKHNEDEEDISLSWSPTPPKAAKAITSTSLSPQSPLSRFSTTARNDGVSSTVSSASASTSTSKQTITSNPYAASSFPTSTTSTTTIRIQSKPMSSYRPPVTAMVGTSSTTFTASSSSSTSITTSGIQVKPSSSFRASATAAVAPSRSTFPTSFPRDQLDSSNPERALVISSQETVITRPDGRDTVSSMDWQTPPNPQSRRVQDQESRGLSRSKSSPNAGGSSIHPIRGKSRLPGPAGNLPRLSEEEKDQLFRSRGVPFRKDTRIPDVANTSPNSSIKKKMKSVSQGPIDSMFASSAWEDMLKAKHLPEYKPSTLGRVKGSNPLLQVTISDIETQQDPHRGKIPWLIAMIKDFTPSEIDAAVTLMDPSGEMRGTIHISVLEQYKNNEIRIGTVLVLNNVSVFSPTPVSHYLIITSRNIKDIYQPNSPMVINSQGSSQDRQSQKKRKNNDSQEVASMAGDPGAQGTNASAQMSGSAIHPSSKSGQYRVTPPAWSSTPEDRSSSHSNGRVSQELRGSGSSQSTSQDQSQGKSRTSLLSSQEGVNRSEVLSRSTVVTQSKEVMFQSLRPTANETQAGQEDMLVTPLITLGALTPSADDGGGGVGAGSGFKSLSSFAASPTLRKRSLQSRTSQRSNSSGSYPESRRDAAGQSQSKTILSPVAGAAASQKSHHTEGDSFTGWPDDIQLDDNFDELETSGLVTLPAKRSAPSDSPVSSRPRPRPPSTDTSSAPVSAPPTTIHDDGNEDDLELLLDGFDESDLYDI
ncbi:hypothetical protein BG015_005653 [Linnemannia schmuckeri]|uniref:Homologous recombination OB-fold protein OB-fold domain-containing protein n=1 Tax=Linnemannia schmuckeri TaxID=64567 RepID=A0A9P5VCH1_9FUNG|nr:hypothetical protein BG015_005653 [Linnemannia schmuckeri]